MNKFKRLTLGIAVGVASTLLTVSLASAATTSFNSKPNVQAKITRQINHMSWRQKIGQMFVGDGILNNPQRTSYLVHHYNLGGVLLDSDNVNGNTRRLDSRMERATHHSLLIGTDEEGGQVSRLGYNPRRYPSPQEAYHRGGMKNVRNAYRYSARKLHQIGINWNYAPDADVATPGSYMYFRAFGYGPKMTAKFGQNAVPAIQGQHVAATLKHFPGYGSARQDTDYYTVRSNRSLSHLERYDFVPFKAGIKASADSIMVTNIILNKVQRGVPATLSNRDINLLRNQLHFNGVVVTDSLNAVSVKNHSRTHHHVLPDYLAMKAGNDMIMTQDFRSAIPKLTRAVKKGSISKRQVNTSVARILMMKYKLGLNY